VGGDVHFGLREVVEDEVVLEAGEDAVALVVALLPPLQTHVLRHPPLRLAHLQPAVVVHQVALVEDVALAEISLRTHHDQ
jgi:hypothetical protein